MWSRVTEMPNLTSAVGDESDHKKHFNALMVVYASNLTKLDVSYASGDRNTKFEPDKTPFGSSLRSLALPNQLAPSLSISLARYTNLTYGNMPTQTRSFPHLSVRYLDIGEHKSLRGADVEWLSQHLPSLRYLALPVHQSYFVDMPLTSLHHLSSFKNLKYLWIVGNERTCVALRQLTSLKSLFLVHADPNDSLAQLYRDISIWSGSPDIPAHLVEALRRLVSCGVFFTDIWVANRAEPGFAFRQTRGASIIKTCVSLEHAAMVAGSSSVGILKLLSLMAHFESMTGGARKLNINSACDVNHLWPSSYREKSDGGVPVSPLVDLLSKTHLIKSHLELAIAAGAKMVVCDPGEHLTRYWEVEVWALGAVVEMKGPEWLTSQLGKFAGAFLAAAPSTSATLEQEKLFQSAVRCLSAEQAHALTADNRPVVSFAKSAAFFEAFLAQFGEETVWFLLQLRDETWLPHLSRGVLAPFIAYPSLVERMQSEFRPSPRSSTTARPRRRPAHLEGVTHYL